MRNVCVLSALCIGGIVASVDPSERKTSLQNFFGAVAMTSAFLPALKRTAQRRSRGERPVVAMVNSFVSRVRQTSFTHRTAFCRIVHLQAWLLNDDTPWLGCNTSLSYEPCTTLSYNRRFAGAQSVSAPNTPVVDGRTCR